MQIVRYVQQKVRPYPFIYKLCIIIYSLFGEIKFLVHAILSKKLIVKYNRNQFSEFYSKQKILEYSLLGYNFKNTDEFRRWLEANEIRYIEGGWTFYLPHQEKLNKFFDFLAVGYPAYAGLKILKDFRSPEKARYTNHKQNPAPGAAIKRFLTPSPVSLVRVANYLYAQGLGVRIYDIIVLKCSNSEMTCYVVQHITGPKVKQKDFDFFIGRIKKLLERGEITTIHENVDIMYDFNPPNCGGNLLMCGQTGKAVYVDFQGFLLVNENKVFNNIINEAKEKVHFGDVRFFRGGKKYLYQSIPGCSVGKRDMETRWNFILEMIEECECSFTERVVYDIGCNTGLMIYNSLSEGAQWGLGWDLPDVVKFAKRILLALGATRFDLFGGTISAQTNFMASIPDRYYEKKNGILFYLAVSDHIGFPLGISELPWEYMFYEGHAKQDYKMSLDRIYNIPWLKEVKIITHRCFADGDTPERVVILLKRKI